MFIQTAYAHEAGEATGEDHDLVATMHIDPNDQPVAGKEAKFYFTLDDPKGRFDINHCDCVITISKDGQQIDQQQISLPNGFASSLTTQPLYIQTFQTAGDYQLTLTGNPKDGVDFEEFAEHYDFKVAAPGSTTPVEHSVLTHGHNAHIIIFGGGLVACIILFIHGLLKNRKNKLATPLNEPQDDNR